MFSIFDPATADLVFTVLSTMGLLLTGAITIAALPWTDAEITATESAAVRLLTMQAAPPRRITH
jgi:hypothetical protein